MKIQFSRQFSKQYNKAPKKIKTAFQQRFKLFMVNKNNPILNNHSLHGRYKEYKSINITGNWRAIFRESKESEFVYFEVLGTHNKLYE